MCKHLPTQEDFSAVAAKAAECLAKGLSATAPCVGCRDESDIDCWLNQELEAYLLEMQEEDHFTPLDEGDK